MSWFGSQDPTELPTVPADEHRVMDAVAARVIKWKMTVPAIIFLESVRPLNYIGSQTLVFFEPMIQTLFNFKDYNTFQRAMERRENIEILLQKIEALDAREYQWEREYKRRLKKARKESKSWLVKLRLKQPQFEMPPRKKPKVTPEEKGEADDAGKKDS